MVGKEFEIAEVQDNIADLNITRLVERNKSSFKSNLMKNLSKPFYFH